MVVFEKKPWIVFKSQTMANFCWCIKWNDFLKIIFPAQLWVFLAKNQKVFKVGKIRNFDEETGYLEKKTLSSFKKASLPQWESAKYAGGSRPFCLLMSLKQNIQKSRQNSSQLIVLTIECFFFLSSLFLHPKYLIAGDSNVPNCCPSYEFCSLRRWAECLWQLPTSYAAHSFRISGVNVRRKGILNPSLRKSEKIEPEIHTQKFCKICHCVEHRVNWFFFDYSFRRTVQIDYEFAKRFPDWSYCIILEIFVFFWYFSIIFRTKAEERSLLSVL